MSLGICKVSFTNKWAPQQKTPETGMENQLSEVQNLSKEFFQQ